MSCVILALNTLSNPTICANYFLSGVMSARGILSNPAMFAGFDRTPVECIDEWVSNIIMLQSALLLSVTHMLLL